MNEKKTGEPETGVPVMLLICDSKGRVQAISSRDVSSQLFECDPSQKHYTEVFGSGSQIAEWLTSRFEDAQGEGPYYEESCFDHKGKKLAVSLEGLKNGEAFYGFAIQVRQGNCGEDRAKVSEGDAIVTRQQWHDIKNQLGGLKLYATFLNRKLPPTEDRQTVERMLNGINVLIEHLAKIRRGELQ
jgi:hypothetical protein